jgi:hypothetical protein
MGARFAETSRPSLDAMSSHWPIVLIEGIIVFGGVLAFAWWQLREIKRDQQKAAQERAALSSGQQPSTPSGAP